MSAPNDRAQKQRVTVSENHLAIAKADIDKRLLHAISKHGDGSFINGFEAVGRVRSELRELEIAVDIGDPVGQYNEAIDVATTIIFFAASLIANKESPNV